MLLWGDRWWFAGTGQSGRFADLDQAVEVLVAHYAHEPKPVRLRLLFQPDTLHSAAAPCPQGDRATLAAALAGEFPELAKADHAWSHEPVLPMGDGFTTLLHFETQPGLLRLATQLAHRGLAVDSAWPLPTFLHALPEEWSNTGAVTVVAAEERRAVSYRHPADGARAVLQWQGDDVLTEVGDWLGRLLTAHPGEPVLLVPADEAAGQVFGTFVGDPHHPGVEHLCLNEALACPVQLPRYHPAQLLPRTPVVTAQRALVAAGIVFLLAAGWTGLTHAQAVRATQAAARDRMERLHALRQEVAHLREEAAEIAGLQRSLEGGAAGPPCGDLLDRIAATLPPEVTLRRVEFNGRTVAIDGWLAPGTGRSAVEDWRARLAPADAPWTADARLGAGGAFSLTGGFRP